MRVATLEIPDAVEPVAEERPGAVVRYSVSDAWIAEAKAKFGQLIAADPKSEAAVRTALTTMVKARTGVEAEYKALTADANARIKLIRDEKNRVIAEMAPVEEHLRAEWDRVEEEKARAKREKEEAQQKAIQDRIDQENAAKKAEQDAEALRLKELADKLAARQKELDQQEADRKAKADAEAAIERKRDEDARKERERLEAVAREEQRQRDEAERKRQQAELDKQAEEQAEQRKKLDAEAEVLRKLKAEADRLEIERKAREQAEKDAAEKVEADRVEALAKAEREAALEARRVALLPDKGKLAAWAREIRAIAKPTVKSAEAKAAAEAALTGLTEVAADLEKFAA